MVQTQSYNLGICFLLLRPRYFVLHEECTFICQ